MTKVVITAQVDDASKWEEGFRTHGELFKRQTVHKPIHFATEGNYVTICSEPDDLDVYLKGLDSSDTEEAMKFDGVQRDTVKVYVLDKVFDLR